MVLEESKINIRMFLKSQDLKLVQNSKLTTSVSLEFRVVMPTARDRCEDNPSQAQCDHPIEKAETT